MMRALLDVNVLIALLDAGHLHHGMATSWISQEINQGWASCPITQNGCVRIMSHPGYPGALPAAQVAERLTEATTDPEHAFWPADISLMTPDILEWSHVLGSRQITDVYLLALAVQNAGRFVTFDKRINPIAVIGAEPENLLVLSH